MERSQKNQRVNSQRDVHSRSGMDNTSNGIVLNLENANSDGNTSKILCAIYFSHGVVGTSIYDELSNVIYTDASQVALEDIDSYLIDLKIFCSPTLFIIHPSLLSNKSLLDVIAIGLDGEENFYRYTVLKSSLWNKRGAIELICRHLVIKEHRIGEERGTSSNFMMQKIATVVDLDVDQLCQTLGSLLHYMQENLFHLDDGNVTISSLKQLPTQSYMRVDTGSMKALQIFCEDIHPNVIKGVGRSKEGFSLFGLFDRTQSSSGRMKLKEWMAKPIFDLQNILYRQRGVEFFALETNRDLTTTIIGMMKHISDLPRMVLRIKKVEATHTEWCKLHTTCNYAVLILGEIVNLVLTDGLDDSSKEYLKGLICLLDISMLDKMRESLSKAIDFAESLAHGQIFIKEGFDSVLDQQRQLYDNLEEQLISAAHKILEVVPMLKVPL